MKNQEAVVGSAGGGDKLSIAEGYYPAGYLNAKSIYDLGYSEGYAAHTFSVDNITVSYVRDASPSEQSSIGASQLLGPGLPLPADTAAT